MRVVHIKKSTFGVGCSSMYGKGLKTIHSFRKTMGNGISSAIFDESLASVKPSRVLQNVRIKRAYQPKKYITFE
tara:strand:- start:583 stop:804 length:222 start_codon:yes stop_codon:yes gene_type:complete